MLQCFLPFVTRAQEKVRLRLRENLKVNQKEHPNMFSKTKYKN